MTSFPHIIICQELLPTANLFYVVVVVVVGADLKQNYSIRQLKRNIKKKHSRHKHFEDCVCVDLC